MNETISYFLWVLTLDIKLLPSTCSYFIFLHAQHICSPWLLSNQFFSPNLKGILSNFIFNTLVSICNLSPYYRFWRAYCAISLVTRKINHIDTVTQNNIFTHTIKIYCFKNPHWKKCSENKLNFLQQKSWIKSLNSTFTYKNGIKIWTCRWKASNKILNLW